ncbi:MAG: SpoIID/LytB domain-containing protein [Sedimentisphaerales bacterium]|nr:SpoIID/LytB domain-containing protein [Sedimentisphaerales bacterium]
MRRLSRIAAEIGMSAAIMVIQLGCDHRETREFKVMSPGPSSVLTQAQDVVIRVFLWECSDLSLAGRNGSLQVVTDDLSVPKTELIMFRSGRLSRRNDKWFLTDAKFVAEKELATEEALIIRPVDGAVIEAGSPQAASYRGILRCIPAGEQGFAVVNELDIESYLAGVVGAEMPAYWDGRALRAQAIACRTYALHQMHRRRSENANWDVTSDQGSQVYGGMGSEDRRIARVVQATKGIVLTYGPAGKEKLFPAYFSSSCGGHTQNAASVFGQRLTPLSGVACPYCKAVAKPEHYCWAPVEVSKDEVSRRLMERYPELASLEVIKDVQVARRSDYGRVEALRLIGRNGHSRLICGEDFRLGVTRPEQALRSSWYDMKDNGDSWRFENGRGWGHGVGLCQCGCEQMARQGRNTVEILAYYYPEATLVRAY